MIQEVKKFHPKLQIAALLGPAHWEISHYAYVYIELPRTIHDSRSTVSESRSDTVSSDYRRGCETPSVEIIVELALDGAVRNQV